MQIENNYVTFRPQSDTHPDHLADHAPIPVISPAADPTSAESYGRAANITDTSAANRCIFLFFNVFLPLMHDNMNKFLYNMAAALAVAALSLSASPVPCIGQEREKISLEEWKDSQEKAQREAEAMTAEDSGYMQFVVENGDTIYFGDLPAATVYQKLPRQKGREWRKYYRLVYNFSKVYPYALVARHIVSEVDSTIAADNLKRGRRDRYINEMQKELFEAFEQPLKSLTVSQGALLMKLIDREVGKSSYSIIKDYKNGVAAGFWQGIARLFGSDLKKPYDPQGDDQPTEELVRKWESGQFDGLYYSLFWEYPPVIELPSKYR